MGASQQPCGSSSTRHSLRLKIRSDVRKRKSETTILEDSGNELNVSVPSTSKSLRVKKRRLVRQSPTPQPVILTETVDDSNSSAQSDQSSEKPAETAEQRTEKIRTAVEAVRSGAMSLTYAAKFHGIKKTTLFDHVHEKAKKTIRGRNTLYSEEQEQIIRDDLITKLRDEGMSAIDCRRYVIVIIEKRGFQNKFSAGEPCGRKWFDGFCQRRDLNVRSLSRDYHMPVISPPLNASDVVVTSPPRDDDNVVVPSPPLDEREIELKRLPPMKRYLKMNYVPSPSPPLHEPELELKKLPWLNEHELEQKKLPPNMRFRKTFFVLPPKIRYMKTLLEFEIEEISMGNVSAKT